MFSESAVPKGSLVLVTGVNGYVGSNVADQALIAGYKVRGIVRDLVKSNWLVDHFEKQYGSSLFELVEVPNPLEANAFDKAVEGVSGIAHVATIAPLSGFPDPYIAQVTDYLLNLMRSASTVPAMKRFVFTSSSMAAANPAVNVPRKISKSTWNEEALEQAWVGPFGDSNIWNVYGASKAKAEQEGWRWHSENQPAWEFNTVLPNTNFGPTLSRQHQGFGSTGSMLKSVYDGKTDPLKDDPPQFFVDIRDTGRLHIIALSDPSVRSERLFAFASPYNWNLILSIFRQEFPGREFPEDVPGLGDDLSQWPTERSEELLKAFGRPGWTTLEQSIRDCRLSE